MLISLGVLYRHATENEKFYFSQQNAKLFLMKNYFNSKN